MSDHRYDAIVIGAGHNGLTAAATLAAKGKSVCVLERDGRIGGMSKSADLGGAQVPEIAHLLYNLNPRVAKDLGLDLKTRALPTVALAPDGDHVVIKDGTAVFADGRAHPDAQAFAALYARLGKFAAVLGQLADGPPPALSGGILDATTFAELAKLGKLGWGLKRLGKKDMREFLRVILSNAFDLVLDEIPDSPLAGALTADAVRGAYAGPRSPGTVFSLMYRLGNGADVALPLGGMGAVARAFETAARSRGVDIRTGAQIERLVIAHDRVQGVLLSDGTTLHANAVLSSAGAMQTLQIAGVANFDVEAARRMRNLRNKGTTAKVNLVLRSAPVFTGLNAGQTGGRLLIAPSAQDVERAFNPAKYGAMSPAPLIEAVIPSLTDPDVAPDGTHVLSAVVSYVPYALEGGWTKKARAQLLDRVVATLDRYAPGIGGLISHNQVLTPVDIENMTGAPGGHWHHAEMGLDQLLTVRPANLLSRYAFGVGGLYLCGASAHPGGDVMGAAGRNAAMQVISDGVLG
ncbi:phytoene desaturase family protein [Octadecabacter sp. R77987]|uniref:phytoene desaturase family protein n=1 Tax=Octadecabacter sp. R77987 TaxID=3093874 RepID=UPI00366DC572